MPEHDVGQLDIVDGNVQDGAGGQVNLAQADFKLKVPVFELEFGKPGRQDAAYGRPGKHSK